MTYTLKRLGFVLYLAIGASAAVVEMQDQHWCQVAAGWGKNPPMNDVLLPYVLLVVWPVILPIGVIQYQYNDRHLCYLGGNRR